jgi:hypothetical protein
MRIRHPCPLAKEYDCAETFSRKGDAAIHAKIHLGVRYPCPYAAELGCEQDFSSQRGVKEHGICHSHRFLCPHNGCSERFTSAEDAFRHSNDPEHLPISVFLCPIPRCRAAVSGYRFSAGSIRVHGEIHIRLGHITKADYNPRKVDALPLRTDLTLHSLILQHATRRLTDHAQGNESLEDIHDGLEHLDSKEADFEDSSSENNDEMDGEMAFEFSEEQGLADLETGILSKEHRLRILGRNTFKWGMLEPTRYG